MIGSFGEIDGGDGHGGDAFLAADETEAFIGGGLDADLGDGDAESFGDALFHFLEMRKDLGAFGDEGGVDVDDATAAGADAAGGLLDEDAAGGVAPRGIGVGEQVADIDFADRTEHGVGDGVEQRIGVAVAIEAERVRDLHPAEDEPTAGDQSVDIVTDADMNHGRRVGQPGRRMKD